MTGAPSNPANAHESVSDWFRNRRRADGMGNRIDRQRRLRQALIPNAARVSARQSVMSDTAFGAGGTLRTQKLSLFAMKKVINIRSEEHTSELQSLMRISYAVFRLKKKTKKT